MWNKLKKKTAQISLAFRQFSSYSGHIWHKYILRVCSPGWGCAVQAEGVQYRLEVCSTSWSTPIVQAEVCSTGWGMQNNEFPPPVLHTLSPYFGCASACISHSQLVLWYGCASSCTAHPQPVLHILYTGRDCCMNPNVYNFEYPTSLSHNFAASPKLKS